MFMIRVLIPNQFCIQAVGRFGVWRLSSQWDEKQQTPKQQGATSVVCSTAVQHHVLRQVPRGQE